MPARLPPAQTACPLTAMEENAQARLWQMQSQSPMSAARSAQSEYGEVVLAAPIKAVFSYPLKAGQETPAQQQAPSLR